MIQGKVWKFGDNVDTDVIIPARYLNTFDPEELAKHCMEAADPEFVNRISPGDILIAGSNFGCGSSREHAPLAIKAAEISCVIAKSFARIFYRNAINIGLPILESAEAAENCQSGDQVRVDLGTGRIENLTTNKIFYAKPFPNFMQQIVNAGGLMNWVKREKLNQ